jgi:poly(3-hydroxybutyrate) depolymerase
LLYHLYDLQHLWMTPMRFAAEATHAAFSAPYAPISYTQLGRAIAATSELVERTTRRFSKPAFGLNETTIDGATVAVREETVLDLPFCTLTHFKRAADRNDPKVLLVAPLSGHYATLLRGTVEALLPHHEVFITEWKDAKTVPLARGRFDLDEFVAYIRRFIEHLSPNLHVVAVCQPVVPVMAAVSLLAEDKSPHQPLTLTLMGGPIDARAASTVPTELAKSKSLGWFERNVITTVPVYYPGGLRRVYPGFVQLTGFMSMNIDRHVGEHFKLFQHLVRGDGDSADSHRRFYDEYLAVMDLTAEFYLQTIATVFQRCALAKGEMTWRGRPVRPAAIEKTALFTIEGELDDISAPGQTIAAHGLCTGLPPHKHFNHLQAKCGHYGIFNGRKWREEIMPRIRDFIRAHDEERSEAPHFGALEPYADFGVKRAQAAAAAMSGQTPPVGGAVVPLPALGNRA